MTHARDFGSRGFTLVEVVIAMLLISIAALGISYVLGIGFRHQSDALWQSKAVALAQAYHEEIASRRFDENSPLGGVPPCSASTTACSLATAFDDGELRATFDDVDDYDGLHDAPPLDSQGVIRSGYDSFTVGVTVTYADAALMAALGLDDATDAKRIRVTVSSPEGNLVFTALRGNY
ncbi:MAG: prepilin-type N-terminal cleavage/methylation domain-containing protein [Gammaproteobacteria bacterium]|nr:prepilin-type N-terminal cleavage/methylation domain-containing protein [Gammaproteobacteria bacterium]